MGVGLGEVPQPTIPCHHVTTHRPSWDSFPAAGTRLSVLKNRIDADKAIPTQRRALC